MCEQMVEVKNEDTKKEKIILTCNEAHLLLRTIEKDMKGDKLSKEQRASINHYWECDDCLKKGLAFILSYDMDCKEALLVWGTAKHWSILSCTASLHSCLITIRHCLAFEHIFGKSSSDEDFINSYGNDYEKLFIENRPKRQSKLPREFLACHHEWWRGRYDACENASCKRIYEFYNVGPHFHEVVLFTMPLLLEIFKEEKWNLAELLKIQKTLILEASGISKEHDNYRLFESTLSELGSFATEDSLGKVDFSVKLLSTIKHLLLYGFISDSTRHNNFAVLDSNLSALIAVIINSKPMPEPEDIDHYFS